MTRSMKRLLSAILLLPALSAFAQDAERHWCGLPQPHPLDAAFARAIDRSGGVTADMRDAQGEAHAGWDGELNRLYRAVMKQLGGDMRAAALRQAQRAWLAWDDAEAVSDVAFAEDQGTSGPLGVADQGIARRRARACTLYQLLDTP